MSLERKSTIVNIGSSETTILENDASTQRVLVSVIFGNVDGDNDVVVTPHLTKSGGTKTNIAKNLEIEAKTAVEMFPGGKGSLFLEAGDKFSATAGDAGDVAATVSYMEET